MKTISKFKITAILIFICIANIRIFAEAPPELEKANVQFIADSRFGKVNGTISQVKIESIDFQKKIATIKVDLSSIDTDNSSRDKHLKSEDFFDVPKFPFAIFQINNLSISDTGDGSGKAMITIKGIKKDFDLKVKEEKKDGKLTYSGSLEINRKEFNLSYDSVINPIKDTVLVKFNVSFLVK